MCVWENSNKWSMKSNANILFFSPGEKEACGVHNAAVLKNIMQMV